MLMPMVWTNDVDDMMDDFFDPYDPFEIVPVVDVEPSKDEIEAAKSVERHARKEGRKYARALRTTAITSRSPQIFRDSTRRTFRSPSPMAC